MLSVLVPIAVPAVAADATLSVTILDLPFKAKAMRGPGSEVALAAATSGVIPLAKPKPASADPKAAPKPEEIETTPVAVVWGEDGGAVLSLKDGAIGTTLIGAEAAEGLAAAETPRVAVPGSRRAVAGPISAYFTGPLRATGQAAGLTIRERQPIGVTADPKPVPVATATVAPGADTVFAARKPRIAMLDAKPAVLAVTVDAQGSSAFDVLMKRGEAWAIVARTPPQPSGPDGTPLAVAGVADFSGTGRAQIAAIRGPDTLQLWSLGEAALSLAQEAPGYAGPPAADDAEFAAVLPPEKDGPVDLALPVADRSALAIVAFKGGIRERARASLPAPAAFGVAALGKGAKARILVGLADGRVAVISGGQP